MKRNHRAILFVICSLLYAINIYASDESPLKRGFKIPQGFTDLRYQIDPNIVTCVFTHENTRITMDVRRGERTPEIVLEDDPEAPPYAIDIRLMDETGTPFFIQTGGGQLVDPSWEYVDNSFYKLSSEEKAIKAKKNFTAAKIMVEKIGWTRFKAELAPEYESILNILPLIEAAMISEGIEGYTKDETKRTRCTDTHIIEIWKQPLLTYAEHSGTVAKIISSGTTYQVWSACNHGTCPGGGYNIYLSCSRSFPNRCPFTSTAPLCATNYGLSVGEHVCNDDTYIQYERIKNDAEPDTWGGTCSDDYLRNFAPDCW